MTWQQFLPCSVDPGATCVDGLTQVRLGGDDGIHLAYGAGTTLEAEGIEAQALHVTFEP